MVSRQRPTGTGDWNQSYAVTPSPSPLDPWVLYSADPSHPQQESPAPGLGFIRRDLPSFVPAPRFQLLFSKQIPSPPFWETLFSIRPKAGGGILFVTVDDTRWGDLPRCF